MALVDAGPLEVLTKDAAWLSAPSRSIYQPFSGAVLVKTRANTIASSDVAVGQHFAPLLMRGPFRSKLIMEAQSSPGTHSVGLQVRVASDVWSAAVAVLDSASGSFAIRMYTSRPDRTSATDCELKTGQTTLAPGATVAIEFQSQWKPATGLVSFAARVGSISSLATAPFQQLGTESLGLGWPGSTVGVGPCLGSSGTASLQALVRSFRAINDNTRSLDTSTSKATAGVESRQADTAASSSSQSDAVRSSTSSSGDSSGAVRVGMQLPPSVLRPDSLDSLASRSQLDRAGVQLLPATVFKAGAHLEAPGGAHHAPAASSSPHHGDRPGGAHGTHAGAAVKSSGKPVASVTLGGSEHQWPPGVRRPGARPTGASVPQGTVGPSEAAIQRSEALLSGATGRRLELHDFYRSVGGMERPGVGVQPRGGVRHPVEGSTGKPRDAGDSAERSIQQSRDLTIDEILGCMDSGITRKQTGPGSRTKGSGSIPESDLPVPSGRLTAGTRVGPSGAASADPSGGSSSKGPGLLGPSDPRWSTPVRNEIQHSVVTDLGFLMDRYRKGAGAGAGTGSGDGALAVGSVARGLEAMVRPAASSMEASKGSGAAPMADDDGDDEEGTAGSSNKGEGGAASVEGGSSEQPAGSLGKGLQMLQQAFASGAGSQARGRDTPIWGAEHGKRKGGVHESPSSERVRSRGVDGEGGMPLTGSEGMVMSEGQAGDDIAAIMASIAGRPQPGASAGSDPKLAEVQAAEDQDIRELLLFEYGGSKAMKRSRLPGGWSLHADDLPAGEGVRVPPGRDAGGTRSPPGEDI